MHSFQPHTCTHTTIFTQTMCNWMFTVGVKASAQAQRWMNKANKDLDQQLKNTPLSSVNPQQ
eukprot:m.44060 g.44060  ORF g.44060 m.44060 type:complete len:62 (+) comp10583_c0_seq1:947-1132(+)